MEIKFGVKEVKKVLEEYYQKNEDFNGKVSISCEVGRGFCRNEFYDVAELKASIDGKLSIYGMEVPMVREITSDEIKTIFRGALEDFGQTVSDVCLDYGVRSETVGYGLCEHEEKMPYFNGVSVKVRNKTYAKSFDYQGR